MIQYYLSIYINVYMYIKLRLLLKSDRYMYIYKIITIIKEIPLPVHTVTSLI